MPDDDVLARAKAEVTRYNFLREGGGIHMKPFCDLIELAETQGRQLGQIRDQARRHIGAPCDCNAIAYRILAILDGKQP